MRAPARWVLLLVALAGRLEAAQPPIAPVVEVARDGLAISRLPSILAEPLVRQQLATGLTTSFVFQATARDAAGGKTKGGARVDVRYDLWDEVYIVSHFDAAGKAARVVLPSFERLVQWWREARLVLVRPPAAAAARVLEVRLGVLPFSQAEQLETQRWFSQALSADKSGSAGAVSDAVEDQPESFTQLIGILLKGSIDRAPLLEYQWRLALAGRTR